MKTKVVPAWTPVAGYPCNENSFQKSCIIVGKTSNPKLQFPQSHGASTRTIIASRTFYCITDRLARCDLEPHKPVGHAEQITILGQYIDEEFRHQ